MSRHAYTAVIWHNIYKEETTFTSCNLSSIFSNYMWQINGIKGFEMEKEKEKEKEGEKDKKDNVQTEALLQPF